MYESVKLKEIQSRVLKAMAEGPEWSKPWAESMPENALTKQPYRGVNALYLSLAGKTRSEWGTVKQWKRLGTQPKPGEDINFVLTHFPIKAQGFNEETGERFQYTIYIERYFNVYCADQVVPIGSFFKRAVPNRFQHSNKVDSFIKRKNLSIIYGGDIAGYSPSADKVYMPKPTDFFATENEQSRSYYYTTLLHELVHWTGHYSRLNRFNHHVTYTRKDEEFWQHYAFEELVAEIGSAMLSAYFGLSKGVREDHINYLAIWMSYIKSDPQTLLKATALAQKAFDYLLPRKKTRKRK